MNFFMVHSATNSIERVISSSQRPEDNLKYKFYPASDGRLNLFYERKRQASAGQFVDLYSVIPKTKVPETIPLSESERAALIEYVYKHKDRETVQRMAFVWRVSERAISRILNEE